MKKLLLALSLTMFAATANAAGLTSVGTLSLVNVAGSVTIQGTMTGNPDSCGASTAYVLDSANPNFKNLLASILTAYASGNNIRFFVNGCITPGATEFPLIQSAVLN